MIRLFKFGLYLMPALFLSAVHAQSGADLKAQNSEGVENVKTDQAQKHFSVAFPGIRNKYLNTLKNDVEPHLVRGDITKLNQNVMRLGSYHGSWAKKGRDFLVANAPLAELYLYRYAALNNPRLNTRILDTLIAFSNYKYPEAALAFADSLALSGADKVKSMGLFRKVILQNPEIAPDIFEFLAGSWGQDIPLNEKLGLAVSVCKRIPQMSGTLRGTFDNWGRSAEQFWELVASDELRSCYSGV